MTYFSTSFLGISEYLFIKIILFNLLGEFFCGSLPDRQLRNFPDVQYTAKDRFTAG